ncbi:MAG: histidine kinase [Lachnospiraceae bacterium]|nr:histidine kinase [Lachnospiraceae bacterium]
MKRLIKDASIQTKLICTHLLLILIPTILIVSLFYSSIYDLIVNDSIRQSFALSKQSASALEARLDAISTVSTAIQNNTFIRQLCTDSISDDAKEELAHNNAFLNDLYTQLDSDMDGTFITSIHIYTDHVPDELYENWLLQDFFLPESNSHGTYWNGIMNSSTDTGLYCPSFYLSHKEINEYGDLAYVERLYPSSKAYAVSPSYLAVYFSSDELTRILKQDTVTENISYIINERQAVVASSDPVLTGAYIMDYDTVRGISASKDGFTTRNVLGQDVYAASFNLEDTDWYMVSVIPSNVVLQRGQRIIKQFSFIYLFTLFIAFLISLSLARSITLRLSAINTKMREARSEPPVRIPDPDSHDEIGELTDSYNYMADQQNLLVKRQQETAEELRTSEIRALQAQINPHFLYNTMDMINWLSQSGERGEVTRAIQALSSFYKLTLSRKDPIADIRSEIEHVKLYVELQNMRFEEKIELMIDIPDDMMSYKLPKLTLQPIVENSILHGILEKESREGTIVIGGWTEEEDAIILISDDGVGMDRETLDSVLSGDDKKTTGTNIAVSNTHRRLQILFGDAYGLTFRSAQGTGTEVEIRIPSHYPETDTLS